jgi:hypothetical protein
MIYCRDERGRVGWLRAWRPAGCMLSSFEWISWREGDDVVVASTCAPDVFERVDPLEVMERDRLPGIYCRPCSI